jgi:homoserine O-acetyltransferase/O-succinyltransferase
MGTRRGVTSSTNIRSDPGDRVRQPGADTQGATHLGGDVASAEATKSSTLDVTPEVSAPEVRVVMSDGSRQLPVTGAWRPGDPVGRRRFLHLPDQRTFVLEGGGQLKGATVAYETWGELDPAGANAVLVCHAVTGDSHVTGRQGPGHPTDGWWEDMIGPGRPIDTDRYFVVCVNVLGGCQGTTGPSSIDPATGQPYGADFPVVTIRDIVRTQAAVADELGIPRWLAVVGGSMGGMQVLEWGVMYPLRVRSLIPLATTSAASAWQISFSRVGRLAVQLDPKWRGGRYYDAEPGDGPHAGLALARMIAHITYRSDQVYEARFGRDGVELLEDFLEQRFEVEGYLDYQGEKFVRRFDANSYLRLNKAMDLHDVGRARGGAYRALSRVQVPTMNVSISSDTLYPRHQQEAVHDALLAGGADSRHVVLDSPHGHDAFLIETGAVGAVVGEFLTEIEKSNGVIDV